MNREKGASLLEVIIAIGLVSVILISLVSLSTKSLSNSTASREKNQATRYTNETIEWVRQERDRSWSEFENRVDSSNTWCMPSNSWSISGPCSSQVISGTSFARELHFNKPQADIVEVTVVTTWMESGNRSESRQATILTKWQ
jgi:Tfp pilus assembly protein PilV